QHQLARDAGDLDGARVDVRSEALEQPVAGDSGDGVGAEPGAAGRGQSLRREGERRQDRDDQRAGQESHRFIALAMASMSSADLIALLFTSNARWAEIMLTISSTTDTFDDSRKP